MSDPSDFEACLRVVSNRCRNLRKNTEKAKQWRKVAESGKVLNEEQKLAVESIGRKEAVIAELEEILRKQQVVVKNQSSGSPKDSSSAKHPSKAKTKGNENNTNSPQSIEATASTAPAENTSEALPASVNVKAPEHVHNEDARVLEGEKIIADLRQQMANMALKNDEELRSATSKIVHQTLNLLHISDFLKNSGSRESLLYYYQSIEDHGGPLLNDLDIDRVLYFTVMLTTPNGNVPHDDAVSVSTEHCIEYLKKSATDAFEGVSYRRLHEIIQLIQTCPLLTERGLEKVDDRGGKYSGGVEGELSNGNQPSHYVDFPTTQGALS